MPCTPSSLMLEDAPLGWTRHPGSRSLVPVPWPGAPLGDGHGCRTGHRCLALPHLWPHNWTRLRSAVLDPTQCGTWMAAPPSMQEIPQAPSTPPSAARPSVHRTASSPSMLSVSSPQPFWHQGLVLWKMIFPQTGAVVGFRDDSSTLHLLCTLFLRLHCNVWMTRFYNLPESVCIHGRAESLLTFGTCQESRGSLVAP